MGMVMRAGHCVFKKLIVNTGIGVAHWRLDLVDTWGKSNIARTLTVCVCVSHEFMSSSQARHWCCSLFTVPRPSLARP